MTHDQAHALLLDLAYGELAPEELTEVSRHAAGCSDCAAELERISATRALLARLGEAPGPSRDREELVEAARRAVARRPTRRWFTRPAALSVGAAAAVVLVVFGVTLQLTRLDGRRAAEEAALAPQELPPEENRAAAPPPAAPAASAPLAAKATPPARRPRPTATAAGSDVAAVASAPAPTPAAPAVSARSAGAPERSTALAAPPPAAAPRAVAGAAAVRELAQGAAVGGPAPRPAEERAARSARAEDVTAGGADASRYVIEDVERRLAAGELVEERRLLRCGDASVERVALVAPGGRVVALRERRGAGAVLEAWYDAAGHLRAARAAGRDTGASSLPRDAPALEAVATTCAW